RLVVHGACIQRRMENLGSLPRVLVGQADWTRGHHCFSRYLSWKNPPETKFRFDGFNGRREAIWQTFVCVSQHLCRSDVSLPLDGSALTQPLSSLLEINGNVTVGLQTNC